MLCLDSQSCPTLCNPMDAPTRCLCPWGFSRQEYWSGLPCPPPGDLPNTGTEPMSPALQMDSLLSEPPGKPINTGVGSRLLPQGIFLTQESNQGLLHCKRILYLLSYGWHMKKHSTSLLMYEMWIRVTIKYHFTYLETWQCWYAYGATKTGTLLEVVISTATLEKQLIFHFVNVKTSINRVQEIPILRKLLLTFTGRRTQECSKCPVGKTHP